VDPTNTSVYVGNLVSGAVTEADLLARFSTVGPVSLVRCVAGATYAFVEFGRHEDAARAVTVLAGQDLKGDTMKLSWGNSAKRQRTQPSHEPQAAAQRNEPVDPNSTSVFVGGLPPGSDTAEQALRQAFEKAGAQGISELQVTGKGYAFVHFNTHDAAAHAISSCDGMAVLGAPVRLTWRTATAKQRPASGRQHEQHPLGQSADSHHACLLPQCVTAAICHSCFGLQTIGAIAGFAWHRHNSRSTW
jgi:RNA recognition motif-containing protein